MNDSSSISKPRKNPRLVLSLAIVGLLLTYVLPFENALSHGLVDRIVVARASPNKATSCQRPCPFRRNLIVLDHLFPAGLNDRTLIFQIMTNLAGYLCATVYVPPPWTMLSIVHNRQQHIPKDLHWDDFYTLFFRQDNASSSSSLPLMQYEAGGQDLSQPFNISQVALFRRPSKSPTDPFWRLALREPTDFVSQVESLDQFVTRQQEWHGGPQAEAEAFLWEIYLPTYAFAKERASWIRNQSQAAAANNHETEHALTALPEQGCLHVGQQASALSLEISNLVFDRIQTRHPTSKTLVLLHIRRTDGMDACNTSLPAMHEYLSCAFAAARDSSASHLGHITILFASDERDICYRQAIQEMITQGLGFGFVDLDATIQETMDEYSVQIPDGDRLRNNMFLFHIYNVMTKDSRIHVLLEKRRQLSCPNCTNIMETLALPISSSSDRHGAREPTTTLVSGWNFSTTMKNFQHCINPSSG